MIFYEEHLYVGGNLDSGAIIAKLDKDLEPVWNFGQRTARYSVDVLTQSQNKIYGIGVLRDNAWSQVAADHVLLYIIAPQFR
jgi:hypothetical protein